MTLRDWLREARILDGFFGLGACLLRLRGPAPRRKRSRLSPTKKYYRPEFDQLEVREMAATLTGITEYTIPTASSGPKGITYGPDGLIWAVESSTNKVFKTTATGSHGWSLAGLDKLVTVTGGVLWVYGSGGASFFSGSSGTYTSPPNIFGTLVKNGDNTFTYTAKDQVKFYFGTDGLETKIVAPNTLTTTFTYASTRISTIKGPDGGTATFTYDGNNQLNKIESPGSRVYTITHDATSKDLTAIQNPDSNRATFTYDSSHRMTNELMGTISTTFQYSGSHGELTTVSLDASTTLAVTPSNTQGLATSPAKNASAGVAVLTDAVSHTTTFTMDNMGRLTKLQTADSATATLTRDFSGCPTSRNACHFNGLIV